MSDNLSIYMIKCVSYSFTSIVSVVSGPLRICEVLRRSADCLCCSSQAVVLLNGV